MFGGIFYISEMPFIEKSDLLQIMPEKLKNIFVHFTRFNGTVTYLSQTAKQLEDNMKKKG